MNIKKKKKNFLLKRTSMYLKSYAKMVSNGTWKDYSFSSSTKEVSFDIYQRASDRPILRILKI